VAALWERTTNPSGSAGAGVVLAGAAGAALADLEMTQFHPTALAVAGPRDGFLVTEAVRGEGARLLNGRGERFVDELAPRDEVALAIEAELRRSG
jgi:L-aspartate oxidase